MAGRVRPVVITVQLEAVLDLDDVLTPLQIPPLGLTIAQFAQFDVHAYVASLQAQLDSPGTSDSTTPRPGGDGV